MIPFRLSRPCVGFKPTIPLAVDGPRMDPPVSVPIPRGAYPAAIATPVPPDDPAGDRDRSCGFLDWPPSELYARRGELRHVHLCQNDSAGIAKLLHNECIVRRNRTFEQNGAAGGRHVERVIVIFEHDRDAV